jgi:hypothetical protein
LIYSYLTMFEIKIATSLWLNIFTYYCNVQIEVFDIERIHKFWICYSMSTLCLLNSVHIHVYITCIIIVFFFCFFFYFYAKIANFIFVRCRTFQKHQLPVQRLRKTRCKCTSKLTSKWRRQRFNIGFYTKCITVHIKNNE